VKVEVLCGMIASGKTTYARQRARQGALIVSHDDLTEMLHGEYRYEQGLRECYRQMEERIAYCGLFHGCDVIIDRTHLTRESRKRWIDFAAVRGVASLNKIPVVAVVFPIESPKVHAGRRFEVDPRGRSYEEWLQVACHHSDQAEAEPLSEDEGFAEIVRMTNPITHHQDRRGGLVF
jgi:hypothetical protein